MNVDKIVKQLELIPHPEGGFYKEVYRSAAKIPASALSSDFNGNRSFATAIYFLIEKDNFSALHKIKSDETWHFYQGDTLEVIEIDTEGHLKTTLVGNGIEEGEVFQYTVKANTWFGSRVKKGGSYSLVGCTVAPGFDFADFEMANRKVLQEKHPALTNIISEMTR